MATLRAGDHVFSELEGRLGVVRTLTGPVARVSWEDASPETYTAAETLRRVPFWLRVLYRWAFSAG